MKKKLSLIVAVAFAVTALFAFTACGSKDDSGAKDDTSDKTATATDDSLKEIQDKGELVLGCDDAFPPMGFVDNGEIVGFDIDLAKAVADKLGVKLVPKPINWETKEAELTTKKIDVIWNGYSITKDRIDKVTFTKPYLSNTQMLVVRADSPIKTKADLKDKIVGVQSDSAAEDLLNEDEAFKGSLKEVRPYDDYQAALNDLKASDRIDAVAVDKILIEYVMKQSPGSFKTLEESLGNEYFGIGCRKGADALADAIDKAIEDLKAEGTTKKLSEEWFAGDQDIVITDVPRQTAADFK